MAPQRTAIARKLNHITPILNRKAGRAGSSVNDLDAARVTFGDQVTHRPAALFTGRQRTETYAERLQQTTTWAL